MAKGEDLGLELEAGSDKGPQGGDEGDERRRHGAGNGISAQRRLQENEADLVFGRDRGTKSALEQPDLLVDDGGRFRDLRSRGSRLSLTQCRGDRAASIEEMARAAV